MPIPQIICQCCGAEKRASADWCDKCDGEDQCPSCGACEVCCECDEPERS